MGFSGYRFNSLQPFKRNLSCNLALFYETYTLGKRYFHFSNHFRIRCYEIKGQKTIQHFSLFIVNFCPVSKSFSFLWPLPSFFLQFVHVVTAANTNFIHHFVPEYIDF